MDFRFGSGTREEESCRGWERRVKRGETSNNDNMLKCWRVGERARIKHARLRMLSASTVIFGESSLSRSIRLISSAERFANVVSGLGQFTREANTSGCPVNDNVSIVLTIGEVMRA